MEDLKAASTSSRSALADLCHDPSDLLSEIAIRSTITRQAARVWLTVVRVRRSRRPGPEEWPGPHGSLGAANAQQSRGRGGSGPIPYRSDCFVADLPSMTLQRQSRSGLIDRVCAG